MKFGVLVFPGSNCDHDTYNVIEQIALQPVTMLWHETEDLEGCDEPATSAQAGASGTRRISSPISQSTATHNASIEAARHQFTNAVPAVRRCCPGDGRPAIVGTERSASGDWTFAYPTGRSGRSITGGCVGSYGTGGVAASSGSGSFVLRC
jgi:hypothetical protein